MPRSPVSIYKQMQSEPQRQFRVIQTLSAPVQIENISGFSSRLNFASDVHELRRIERTHTAAGVAAVLCSQWCSLRSATNPSLL